MNILFWNLGKNSIGGLIQECLLQYEIDVAIFSEHQGVAFERMSCVKDGTYSFIQGNGGCERIKALVKHGFDLIVRREQDRFTLYSLRLDNQYYNIVGVHLHDRWTTETARRISTINHIVNEISNIERSSKNKNTIVIGDFNANPYDPEMLQYNAFNAVLFKDLIIKSETRTVDGVSYRRFYNPIINSISEDEKNYGSFYHSEGDSTPVWHCIDQIIVGKALVNRVHSVKYIKYINNKSLINRVKPNKQISDHLPLFANIE